MNNNKARNTLIIFFGVYIIFEIGLLLFQLEFTGFVRLILTVLLMRCVLLGYKWAKWLIVLLCSVAVIIGLAFGIYTISHDTSIALLVLLVSAILAVVPIYIVFNPDINAYFEHCSRSRSLQNVADV